MVTRLGVPGGGTCRIRRKPLAVALLLAGCTPCWAAGEAGTPALSLRLEHTLTMGRPAVTATGSTTGSTHFEFGLADLRGRVDQARERVGTLHELTAAHEVALQATERRIEKLQRLISVQDDVLRTLGQPAGAGNAAMPGAVASSAEPAATIAPALPDVASSSSPVERAPEPEPVPTPATPTAVAGAASASQSRFSLLTDVARGLSLESLLAPGGALLVVGLVVVAVRRRKRSVAEPEAEQPAVPAVTVVPTARSPGPATTALPDFQPQATIAMAVDVISPPAEPAAMPSAETTSAESAAMPSAEPAPTSPAESAPTPSNIKPANHESLKVVDTFIAFEDYDSAAQVLDDLMAGNPDNPEYRLRRLHVEAERGNNAESQEEEEILAAMMDGPLSETLTRVRRAGRGMRPGNPLFDSHVPDAPLTLGGGGYDEADADEPVVAEGAAVDQPAAEPAAPELVFGDDAEAPAEPVFDPVFSAVLEDDAGVQVEDSESSYGAIDYEVVDFGLEPDAAPEADVATSTVDAAEAQAFFAEVFGDDEPPAGDTVVIPRAGSGAG